MKQQDFDLFVIGGGSGGVRAARWAASKGLKVGIAEGARLGGTCVNLGCVPKKLFFHAAHMSSLFSDAQSYGWSLSEGNIGQTLVDETLTGGLSHDWSILKQRVDAYITRLNGIYGKMLDRVGVTRYEAWARLIGEHEIELRDSAGTEQVVRARHILLSPGGKAIAPSIEGVELGSSSDEFFALEERPRSVAVIGGGYIGVEMAGVFAGLGVETTIAYRSSLPLRGFDQDLRVRIDISLREQMSVRPEARLVKIEGSKNGLKRVFLSDSDTPLEVEFVLLATGRAPRTEGLNLDLIGVECSPDRGAIVVNERYQTNLPHIYAVGDVIDRMQLTPVALAEAMRVVEYIVGEPLPPLEYDLVPTTVFCHPNIGTVGLSEEEALKRGQPIKVYEADFKPLHQALQPTPRRVYMKMIVHQETDRVIGCHMIGDEAGEQIQGLAVAMQAGVTKAQLDQTVGIHPTMAEEWVTMRTPRS